MKAAERYSPSPFPPAQVKIEPWQSTELITHLDVDLLVVGALMDATDHWGRRYQFDSCAIYATGNWQDLKDLMSPERVDSIEFQIAEDYRLGER